MTSPAEEGHPAVVIDIPAEPEPDQEKARDPRELLMELRTRFEVFRTFQPLAIGIDKTIRSRFPEADRKTLRIALSMHTHCNRYLRLLAKAEQRFDLDGQPVAEVSEEHRQFATTALEERLQRQAGEQAKQPSSAKPSKSPGRRNHPRKQANGAAENDVSAASAEKAENGKPAEKSPRKKYKVGKKHAPNASSRKAQSPATPSSLAEKLALLVEKFGHKA
jgi:ProP effector